MQKFEADGSAPSVMSGLSLSSAGGARCPTASGNILFFSGLMGDDDSFGCGGGADRRPSKLSIASDGLVARL
jgi:hypothetical protein